MALQYKAKPWSELTTDEFYDIMQLRIQCFIVDLQTCYQDMEAYYDKCGWYMMYYKGNVMVGCNQLCTRKELYGADGTKYTYPAWRRQAWIPGHRDPKIELPFSHAVAKQMTGKHYMMCEVLHKKYADHIERNAGYRVVNEYVDEHGRTNWLLVNDHIEDNWKP